MNNAERKKVGGWDRIIEHEEEVASSTAQAINAGVTAFEAHKERLLSILRNAWERSPKCEAFDVDRAWRSLTSIATEYYHRKTLKRKAVPTAERSKRLGKIAKVLGEACSLFDEAKQDDLRNDLYLAWRDQSIGGRQNANEADPDGILLFVGVRREFARIIPTLYKLHAAACKARDDVVPLQGRPQGSILDPDIIDLLARNYQRSTGLKLDKLTDKHFIEFVGTFVEAIGGARKRPKDYALEAIKYSLKLKRKRERPIRE
jgi:hypothetical protein